MHFVKYVCATAPGSRWDISAEYFVKDEGDEGLSLQEGESSEGEDDEQDGDEDGEDNDDEQEDEE
jgi:hypothetical protein